MRRTVLKVTAAFVVPISIALYVQATMSLSAVKAAHAAVNLAGKRAFVTGGTSGIGEGIAVRLAEAGASVTIVGRSAEHAADVLRLMNGKTSSSGSGAVHEFIQCDAFSIANIKSCVEQYKQKHEGPLDFLVLSQGMATLQGFTPTPEGLDQKLTLHYFGRMAFIGLLLPQLRQANGKVLSVLSGGIHSSYQHYATDLELREHYSIKNAADAAGFYTDLFLDSLSREDANKDVAFFHAAPGFIATRWGTEMPTLVRWLVNGLKVLARSKEDCAEYMCVPLFDSSTRGFSPINQFGSTASLTAIHEEARDPVFQQTKALLKRLGIDF
jgi:NAD(P)-dependent dehydrogenase (short-subunit alcohol dehydrogenase family)